MINKVLSIFNSLQNSFKVDSAFLEPLQIEDIIIIPIVRKEISLSSITTPAMGVSGGGAVTPHSFIIIKEDVIKITGFNSFQQDLASLLDKSSVEEIITKILKGKKQ